MCAENATYLSKATSADLIECSGHHIDSSLLDGPFYSIIADESTDISLKEKLSVCGRWIEKGKAVEHYLGRVHAKEVTAKVLTQYLLDFLLERGIPIQKFEDWGLMVQVLCLGQRADTDANEVSFS